MSDFTVRPRETRPVPVPAIVIEGRIELTEETAIELSALLGAKHGADGPNLYMPLIVALKQYGVSESQLDDAYDAYESRKGL